MSEETSKYKEHYMNMEQTLRDLENMDVPDVDKVIPLMETFNENYQKCMSRIEQVEQLRNEMMSQKQD